MEIILKQDVAKLGNKDDVVKVKNGYAVNYLIPQGYGTLATVAALKQHAENQKQRAHKEAAIKTSALETAKKLEGIVLTIGAKASSTGKIFGSVNTLQLAEVLHSKGFDIDRKQIVITSIEQVKALGRYTAEVKLHRDVKVNIDFDVVVE
jgi:large subunit ribosomal protein L9